ncbi:MAG: N-6 DNA methylase [Myxococcaceae bacterium]|nr:N-6 DNA methylase [Myxococcaceae bacterium]
MRHLAPPGLTPLPDEEALSEAHPGLDRRSLGAYFTPRPLVERTLALAREHLPCGRSLTVVDPACGAGAFLVAAREAFPSARLFGLELSPEVAATCAARVPDADIRTGDALRGGLEPLLAGVPEGDVELWVGNPPYNGTSTLLKDAEAYGRVRALLTEALPRGTSLRDDYAFFLLLAAQRLEAQDGVLAFITSATLLDAFLYGPLRRSLLSRLQLREVVDLGAGAFRETRVRTCITVWTSRRSLPRAVAPRFHSGVDVVPLSPEEPELLLRPRDTAAEALDSAWRTAGEPLDVLVPVSFPGLKTRFDELLVDEDRERLAERIRAFLDVTPAGIADFARRWALPETLWPKLAALHASIQEEKPQFSEECLRPFYRYAGARHRGSVPASALAWCYLERRLIPRGDHRFRGTYDPHVEPVKLVFNVRELPLSAALVTEPGCVHAHRHARFAPLHVPVDLARPEGPWRVNLSEAGLAEAQRFGGPAGLYRAVCAFINSAPVQRVWAPAFGATRVLPVPLRSLRRAR